MLKGATKLPCIAASSFMSPNYLNELYIEFKLMAEESIVGNHSLATSIMTYSWAWHFMHSTMLHAITSPIHMKSFPFKIKKMSEKY